jgi:2-methylcitrate dehydratase PrpD
MTAALGLAANHACGLRQSHASMTNHYTPAHAARAGLVSALLAARGFTASANMLEGESGFAAAYCKNPDFEAALGGLGSHFEIAALSYKPYPCGFVSHGVVDACLEIARRQPDLAGVEAIGITVHPLAAKLMDRPQPRTRDEAIASIQYWAAAALTYKAAGLAQTRDDAIRDARVCALIPTITLRTDAAMPRGAAEVRVVLKNGEALHERVMECRGSAARPLTDEDLTLKSRGQLMTVFSAQGAERIVSECWRIAEYENAGTICAHLTA